MDNAWLAGGLAPGNLLGSDFCPIAENSIWVYDRSKRNMVKEVHQLSR